MSNLVPFCWIWLALRFYLKKSFKKILNQKNSMVLMVVGFCPTTCKYCQWSAIKTVCTSLGKIPQPLKLCLFLVFAILKRFFWLVYIKLTISNKLKRSLTQFMQFSHQKLKRHEKLWKSNFFMKFPSLYVLGSCS